MKTVYGLTTPEKLTASFLVALNAKENLKGYFMNL